MGPENSYIAQYNDRERSVSISMVGVAAANFDLAPFTVSLVKLLIRSCKLIELPRVGGLHHRYEWSEAA